MRRRLSSVHENISEFNSSQKIQKTDRLCEESFEENALSSNELQPRANQENYTQVSVSYFSSK